MVGGICIIFLLGIIPYSLSAPDPLDTVNININLDEGTNKGYASDYVGDYRYRKKYSRKYGSRKYGRKYGSRKKGRNMVTEKKATSGITKRGVTSIAGRQREQVSETRCKTPTPSIAPESMTIQDGDRIYAGFYKPSSMQSGYIKFNICKKGSTNEQYDCSHPGGELTMFGGGSDPIGPPEQSVTKEQVTENVKKAGITKIDDLRFTITSVEDLDGNKIEGEVAHPILVFRPKIRTHDLHTIFFNTSVIQPPAIKMTKGVKIRIESQNEKIFHVNNEDDFEKCNREKFFCMAPKLYMDKEFIRGNGNNHNGSYYFFDIDGVRTGCFGRFAKSSRGSKVQIIIDPKNNP